MIVYDQNGKRLSLGTKLGGGGEGSVYAIDGHPSFVAKIYSSGAEAHREKIEAMVSVSDQVARVQVLSTVAWPMAALYSDAARRTFVGFGMACVRTRYQLAELHEYPAPAGMSVTLREKVDFMIGACDILAALHAMGQVVGDFNDQNVIMTTDGRPAVVDADSFCVRVGGRTFPCEVFNDSIVAPEIIKAARVAGSYAACPGDVFSAHADDYALAVHIFCLLMNGVHPFTCVPMPLANGSVPAPVKRAKRVERGETPFFKKVPGVKVSPMAPDLAALPPYLTELFRRAFVDGHASPAKRPTATEWKAALTRYRSELVPCSKNRLHWHWRGVSTCPYCEADARYGKKAKAATIAPVVPRVTTPPFQGANPASRAANGVAAAVQAPTPAKAAGLGTPYWIISLLIGAGVFLLLGMMLPVCASVGYGLGIGYPDWLMLSFFVAALVGVIAYNLVFVDHVEAKNYLLAAASAAGGMAAVVAVIIALGIALILLILGIILAVFSD